MDKGKQNKLPYYYEPVEETKLPTFGIRHLQAAMMCICLVTLYIIRSTMGAAILEMTNIKRAGVKTYDWDSNIQNILLSSFFWGYMVMQVPAGILAKKFGGKLILLFSLVSNATLCLAIPFVTDWGWQWLCAVRIFMGLTQACLFPSCHTLFSKWILPNERTRICNFVYAGTNLGTIISLPLSGFLASTAIGWPLIFYVLSIICFAVAILWYLLSASYPSEHKLISEVEKNYIEMTLKTGGSQKDMPIPWASIFKSVPFWATATTHVGFNWAFLTVFVETPTYFKNILGFSREVSSELSALPFVLLCIMCMVFSCMCDYLLNNVSISVTMARKIFNFIGAFGYSACILGVTLAGQEHRTLSVVFFTMALGFYASGQTSFMVNQMDLSPNYAGLLLAITNCISNGIAAAAPLVAASFVNDDPYEPENWKTVFYITMAVVCGCSLFFIIFGSGELQPWNNAYTEQEKSKLKGDIEEAKTASIMESLKKSLQGIDVRKLSMSSSITSR